MTAARIGFTGPGGTQHVMGRLGPGLALALAAAAADAPAAVLAAAVPDPHGSARLAQAILADDYRGATVTLRAQVRAADVAGHAGLELRIRAGQPLRAARGEDDAGRPAVRITGTSDWASHEITARVPGDASVITFGITLTGRGEIGLRQVELSRGT